jgi:hypothetical protein
MWWTRVSHWAGACSGCWSLLPNVCKAMAKTMLLCRCKWSILAPPPRFPWWDERSTLSCSQQACRCAELKCILCAGCRLCL